VNWEVSNAKWWLPATQVPLLRNAWQDDDLTD
jgi:hypothetical protein